MIVFWFIVVSLAVYRIARMLAMEDGPFFVFKRWRDFLTSLDNNSETNWLQAGFSCTFCISFWLALLFGYPLMGMYQLSEFQYILLCFGISGLVVMYHRYFG